MNETTEERYGRNRNGRRGRGSGFIIITINPTREGRCRDGRNVGKGKGVEWEIGKGTREERGRGNEVGVKDLRQRRVEEGTSKISDYIHHKEFNKGN